MGGLIGISLADLPKSPIRKPLLNDMGSRMTESSLTHISVYPGLNVRLKTFDEGLIYLKTINALFDPHTPKQWRKLNIMILKPQDDEWILYYSPRLTEPPKDITPKMVTADETML